VLITARKLFRLFDRRERAQFAFLGLLIISGGVAETLSIGLILPAMTALTLPEKLPSLPFFPALFTMLGRLDTGSLFLVVGTLVLLAFTAKNVFLGYVWYRQNGLVLRKQAEFSTRMLRRYLYKPYLFHVQHNSANLVRNVNGEVAAVFTTFVMPSIMAISEFVTLISIGVLLLWIDPLSTILAAALVSVTGYLFYLFVRHQTHELGVTRLNYSGEMHKALQQALFGAKEIKVLGCEEYFAQRYFVNMSGLQGTIKWINFMGGLPRLFNEPTLLITFFVVFGALYVQSGSVQAALPKLAVFAIAAFRMMPAANRITTILSKLRFGLPSLNVVYDNLIGGDRDHRAGPMTSPERRSLHFPFEQEIVLHDATFTYPGQSEPALKGVSLAVPKGARVGLVGSSGAGKSTIADLLLGLMPLDRGRILVDGKDIAEAPEAWQRRVGYIPQSIYLLDDTLRRNVAFGLEDADIDESRIIEVIRLAGLATMVEALPRGLDTVIGERGVRLSGGQRQRVGIARALYRDPDLLVMDEATSAVDNITERDIMQSLDGIPGDKTLIIIAHRLTTIRSCDCIYILSEGRLMAQGTYDELLSQSKHFRAMVEAAA
jgi:ABC-type multidrug transport system fused ATPase/permease subunit